MPARKLLLLSPLVVVAVLLLFVRANQRSPTALAVPAARAGAVARAAEDAGPAAVARPETAAASRAAPSAARALAAGLGGARGTASTARDDAPGSATARALVVEAATGLPVAGARVAWAQDERRGEATTDAAGQAALALDPRGARVTLRVAAAGFAPFERMLDAAGELLAELRAPAELRGLVREAATGVPVPGAEIAVRGRGARGAATSDASGAYVLADLPRDEPLRIEVAAKGFPAQVFHLALRADAAAEPHDLELVHGQRLTGRVVDRDTGAPVAGATLACGWAPREVHAAGADGVFDVELLPNPRVADPTIRVEAPDHCPLVVHLTDAPRAGVTLPLVRPGWIEGVVRAPDGAPVAGAEIELAGLGPGRAVAPGDGQEGGDPSDAAGGARWPWRWAYASPAHTTVRAGGDGRFRSPPIPRPAADAPGTCTLRARADGHAAATQSVRVPGTDEVVRVELVLEPAPLAASVRGTALLNGVPCSGELSWRAGDRGGTIAVPAGDFLLEDLPPGAATLTFAPLGVPLRMARSPLAAAGGAAAYVVGLRGHVELTVGREARVDLEMTSELGEVRGRAATLAGEPLVGVRVVAALGEGAFETRTDATGTYWLELPVLGAPYTLICRPGDDQEQRAGVEPGAVVDFVFPVYAEARVRARDAESGAPVAGLRLAWSRAGSGDEPRGAECSVPDARGRAVARLPVGRLDLRASARGYLPVERASVDVAPGGGTAELELALERWRTVDLVLEEGCPPLPDRRFVFLVEEDRWRALRFEPRPGGPAATFDGRDEAEAARREVRFGRGRTARVTGVPAGVLRFKTIPNDVEIRPATIELPRPEPGAVRVRWTWRDRRAAR